MMDRTDRHFRFVMRQISRHALLYTEMITTRAILHGDRDRLLAFHPVERPLSLQIGTDDPIEAAQAARIAEEWGFDEINLNVGCPSDRVKQGSFGACLMAEPERVRDLVSAMADAAGLPVTVKHRIGIDHQDAYADMLRFVDIVAEPGRCARFSVHARKAWLEGLSPKENRTIPPLRHPEVHRLKRERPGLCIETNGGIRSLDEVEAHLEHVDAAMIGRAAYETPMAFAEADRRIFGDTERPVASAESVVAALLDYIEVELAAGTKLQWITRHLNGLMAGRPGAGAWRRTISEGQHRAGAGPDLLVDALARTRVEMVVG
jgi:tRNA-dihydrouridine synthase A